MKKRFTLLLFSICWLGNVSISQSIDPQKLLSQYIIDQWTTKEGLPTNTINDVYQSEDGFLWLSSYNGLIRFDGLTFSVFDRNTFDSLSNSSVGKIYQTQDGRLWIGTFGSGILVRDNHKFSVYSQEDGFLNYPVESLIQTANGDVWIGTRGKGIVRYQNGNFEDFNEIPELADISINELQEDNQQTLWIGTEGQGLFSYKDGSYKNYKISNDGRTINVITGLLVDNKENVWIGGIEGLFLLKNGNIKPVPELEGITINDIIEDKYGSIWLATTNGVFRKSAISGGFESLNTDNGLPHNNVMSITIDREGSVWLAMYRAGLVRIKDGKFTNYTQQQGLASISISSVSQISKNTYWVGTDVGVINTITNNKIGTYPIQTQLTADRIRQIFLDKQGNKWVTIYSGLLRIYPDGREKLYTVEDGLTDNQVRVVCQTVNGSIWVGTRGGGLVEYNSNNDTWQPFTVNEGLTSNFILGMEPTEDGKLVVATNNGGVNVINLQTRKVDKVYSSDDGLPSDLVFVGRYDSENILWLCTNAGLVAIRDDKMSIFDGSNGFPIDAVFDIKEDDNKNLWMSSSKGVIRLDRSVVNAFFDGSSQSIEVTIFDRQDGMKAEECTGAVYFLKDREGKMWFPTIGGISVINPSNIKTNPVPPPTYITSVQVDSINYPFPKEAIQIESGVKRVIFKFTGLSLVSPTDMKFKYRLRGFDDDWIEVTNERQALYTGLDPKTYVFEVMSANNDGVWSKEAAQIKISVKPFYYQTVYFWVAIALLLLLLFFLAYRFQVRRIRKQNIKLEELVKQRTAEINTQKEEIEAQRDRIEEQRQAISKSYQQISLVGDIGQKITSTLHTEALVETVHHNISQLMSAEGVGIGIYRDRDNKIEFKHYIENGEKLPRHSDALSHVNRFSVQCFNKKKAILVNDVEQYFKDNHLVEYLDVGNMPQSLIYVPLFLNEKTVGVITVQSFNKNAYTQEDVIILEALAAYISIARSNAKSYEVIEEKNKNITDSIRYALTIQQAVLPSNEEMNALFKEYFVLFRPKDIVSGDFYWAVRYKGRTFIAVIDCTGHGVPGGFMSMIANALLNEIVTIERIFSPAAILERLHHDVQNALQQEKYKNDDGMDVALLCIEDMEANQKKLTFAGAKQAIYYNQNYDIIKLKGDKMSIGGLRPHKSPFSEQEIILERDTMVYMLSDGLADQADTSGNKIGSKTIEEKLGHLHLLSAAEQKSEFETLLERHQRTAPQRDDITLLGVRI